MVLRLVKNSSPGTDYLSWKLDENTAWRLKKSLLRREFSQWGYFKVDIYNGLLFYLKNTFHFAFNPSCPCFPFSRFSPPTHSSEGVSFSSENQQGLASQLDAGPRHSAAPHPIKAEHGLPPQGMGSWINGTVAWVHIVLTLGGEQQGNWPIGQFVKVDTHMAQFQKNGKSFLGSPSVNVYKWLISACKD